MIKCIWSSYIYFFIDMSVIFGVINIFKLHSFEFLMLIAYLTNVFHWHRCHLLCHGSN
jgi:hypothetical protein